MTSTRAEATSLPTKAPLLNLPFSIEKSRIDGVFWRPNALFVNDLVDYLGDRPVLEIFAGNGMLAAMLSRCGVDITSTSIFSGYDAHSLGLYHPVIKLDAVSSVTHLGHSHEVLLISWPIVTEAVLDAVKVWGTTKDVVFIGEFTDYAKNHLGGCATDAFFESIAIRREFESYHGNIIEKAVVCRLLSA